MGRGGVYAAGVPCLGVAGGGMLIPRYINRILVWFARCVFLRYLFLAPFRAHARSLFVLTHILLMA